MTVSKLNPVALGIACGIITGLTVFGMGILAQTLLPGQPIVVALGTMYLSFTGSFMNSLLGGMIGLVNAYIAGYIAAWVYNIFIDLV